MFDKTRTGHNETDRHLKAGRKTIENLSSCMPICKFCDLSDEDRRQIFQMANG